MQPDASFCRHCGTKRPINGEFPADMRLVAWMRRRGGPDCDFGEAFAELFGGRAGVGPRRFAEVLEAHGFADGRVAFAAVDRHAKSGLVGASDFELLQVEVEDREAEGLHLLRDFLKQQFSHPAAAYKAMGKQEGDAMNQAEFAAAMQRLGFETDNPLKLFHFLDKDFSGEICFAEFKAVLRAARKSCQEPRSVQRRLSESSPAGEGAEAAAPGPRRKDRHKLTKKPSKLDLGLERIDEERQREWSYRGTQKAEK